MPIRCKKKKRLLECLHKRLDLVRMMLKSPPSHASGECSNWLFRGAKGLFGLWACLVYTQTHAKILAKKSYAVVSLAPTR
jgi:hypothetical protein